MRLSEASLFICLMIKTYHAVDVQRASECFYDVYNYDLKYEITNSLLDGRFDSVDVSVCKLGNSCVNNDGDNWIGWDEDCYMKKEYHSISCDFTSLKFLEFYVKLIGVNSSSNNLITIDKLEHSSLMPCNCYNVEQLLPKKINPRFTGNDGEIVFSVNNFLDTVHPSFLKYSIELYNGDDDLVKNIEPINKGFELDIVLNDLQRCHAYILKFSFNADRCYLEEKDISVEHRFIYAPNESFFNTSCSSDSKETTQLSKHQHILIVSICCALIAAIVFYLIYQHKNKTRLQTQQSQLSLVHARLDPIPINRNEPIYEEIL